MSQPSVSFICTFYNKGPYVALVLNSIKNQVYDGAVEYIFVDDGSSDDSLALLHEHTKDWPACRIVSQRNGGQTAATITALKLARHDYIKTWDGDDYAHSDLTRLLIDACEKHDVSFAYCEVSWGVDVAPDQLQEVDTWLKNLPQSLPSVIKENFLHDALRGPVVNPTGALFRRSLLEKIGLPDPRVVIVDTYIPYTAALFTDFACIPSVLAFASRDVPGRLTSNEAQIMHDLNAALACCYTNFYQQLSYKTKLFVGKRAASRARNWARRRHRQNLLGRFGRLYLRSLLPIPLAPHTVFKTCEAFRQGDARVRLGTQETAERYCYA